MSILTGKYNQDLSIMFDIEEIKKLNNFKNAVNSAFQMNVNIEEISIYYQCNGETEEEALIMNNNDEEFNDILYFNNKDIEIIKFIIKLDECRSSIKIDDKFAAQAVLELVDQAAAKAEVLAAELTIKIADAKVHLKKYDITKECNINDITKDGNIVLSREDENNNEEEAIAEKMQFANEEIDIKKNELTKPTNDILEVAAMSAYEMQLRPATGMKLPAQYDEEIKLKPADDDTLEVTKNEEVNGHERPIFDDENAVDDLAAKFELEEVLKKCVDENVLYNDTIGKEIINETIIDEIEIDKNGVNNVYDDLNKLNGVKNKSDVFRNEDEFNKLINKAYKMLFINIIIILNTYIKGSNKK
eukprot:142014_1